MVWRGGEWYCMSVLACCTHSHPVENLKNCILGTLEYLNGWSPCSLIMDNILAAIAALVAGASSRAGLAQLFMTSKITWLSLSPVRVGVLQWGMYLIGCVCTVGCLLCQETLKHGHDTVLWGSPSRQFPGSTTTLLCMLSVSPASVLLGSVSRLLVLKTTYLKGSGDQRSSEDRAWSQ